MALIRENRIVHYEGHPTAEAHIALPTHCRAIFDLLTEFDIAQGSQIGTAMAARIVLSKKINNLNTGGFCLIHDSVP